MNLRRIAATVALAVATTLAAPFAASAGTVDTTVRNNSTHYIKQWYSDYAGGAHASYSLVINPKYGGFIGIHNVRVKVCNGNGCWWVRVRERNDDVMPGERFWFGGKPTYSTRASCSVKYDARHWQPWRHMTNIREDTQCW